MLLTEFVGGNVPDYIEFGWLTNPTTGAQGIAANTLNTIYCDTLVANPSNLAGVSINSGSHIMTIPAGEYYFEGFVPFNCLVAYGVMSATAALYNNTAGTYTLRAPSVTSFLGGGNQVQATVFIKGNFKTTSSQTFSLRGMSNANSQIFLPYGTVTNTLGGPAYTDLRTYAKFWKLK